ncbi:MAG: hypothetical protein AABX37_03195, partial [Nanoarchaeota archaeon]
LRGWHNRILDQVREVVQETAPPALQRIHFQKEIGQLVNERGVPYEGNRMNTISTHSARNHPTQAWAENDALDQLVTLAEQERADAYEVIGSSVEDSKQECDGAPYTATITAILYKNK